MSIRFACPSCGAAGSAAAALGGEHVRCRHCKHRFAIPRPGEPEADVYALDGSPEGPPGDDGPRPEPGSTFVRRRGEEPITAAPRKARRPAPASGSTGRPARRRGSGFAWRVWLIRGVVLAVLTLAVIALFAPHGSLIVGCVLLAVGSVMVLVGYAVGAYGAFREDSLYGFLYLLIPLYAAYYLLSRWEDLWPWFACSTAGVALVALGTEMLRWNGVGA
jgi:hypothetical protein